MIHSTIGLVHTMAAFSALLLGAMVFMRPKFGIRHKVAGYAYTVAMVIMIVTALMIYRLSGTFNLLHVFALVSTATLARALYHAVARKPRGGWLERHYLWMSWSYIGLFAALIAETATRVGIPYLFKHQGVRSFGWFWAVVILVMFGVCFLGAFMIERNRKILNQYVGSR